MKYLLLAFVFAAAPAIAAPVVSPVIATAPSNEPTTYECYIGGQVRPGAVLGDNNPQSCGPNMQVPGRVNTYYNAFRLPPLVGVSGTPINAHGMCFYVTNGTGNTYFVPSGTAEELNSFYQRAKRGQIDRLVGIVDCAQDDRVNLTAEELCQTGRLVTRRSYPYEEGSTFARSRDGLRQHFFLINENGELLREVNFVTMNDGTFRPYFSNQCPPTDGAQPRPTPVSTQPVFDRNGGNTQRVPVYQEPVVRNVNDTRVMITDGAIRRGIQ